MRCEEIVDLIIKRGGQVVVEKQEGSSATFCGRTVVLENESCKFKIGYLNLGEKQISVQQMCCQRGGEEWRILSKECLDILKENPIEETHGVKAKMMCQLKKEE